jgi:hypothetical protein
MNKELTDVSSYIKTVNYVDLSVVLGTTGCNDQSFIEYLDNESYSFGTNALTLATSQQLIATLQSYNDILLTPKVWVINALNTLYELPSATYINLED